jgi:hypothetical protein
MANLLCVSPSQVAVTAIARAAAAGGGSSGHRRLSEGGVRVSVQVTWSLAAGSSAQARSLVQAGQHVMGLPAMGRRQLKRKKKSSCVVGKNVGPLIKTAKAVVPCMDKANSGFAGLACPAAIAQFKHGCAGSAMSATFAKNCPKSCGKCKGGTFAQPKPTAARPPRSCCGSCRPTR